MDFEKILKKCGDFDSYQFLLLAIFGFINFFASMHYFAQTIISFVPEHWCYHEKLVNKMFSEIREIYSQFDPPSCTRLDDVFIEGNVTVSDMKCDKWIYNYDYGYRSINTEFNWVCDSAYKSNLGQSMFFIGSAIGTLLYGFLADKYGRLPLLVVANLSAFAGDIATIFCKDVISFSICRFFSGMAADSNTCLMYIIVLEYMRPSMRILCFNLTIGIFTCISLSLTPWIAVLTGHWQYYLCCTSVPFVLVICVYFIISESAQWLVTNNDVEGAIKRLRRIAKFNGKNVSDEDYEKYRLFCINEKSLQSVEEAKANIFDLFKTPSLRKKTLILFYLAMITTLCHNAVTRNVEGIGLSPFILFSLSSLTILPAGLVLSFLQNKIGRKGMTLTGMLFCGLTTIAAGIFTLFEHGNTDYTNIMVLSILQILSRFGVALAFESGGQFACDIIPTCNRGQSIGAMRVAASAVSFLSTPLLYLAVYFKALPSFILAGLFFSGGIVCLFLPETLNKPVPKTLRDAEEFGKDNKFLDFVCCSSNRPKHFIDKPTSDFGEKALIQRKKSEDFALIAPDSVKNFSDENNFKNQKLLEAT